jgi:hypothetical protein
MSFFKRLFGSQTQPTLFAGSTKAIPARPPASAAPSATRAKGHDYFNKEWNFGIAVPNGWNIVFENKGGNPWMQPLRIAGPKASRGQPFLSVLVAPVQEDGKGLQAYMDKAERDLSGAFTGFTLDAKRETTLLGFPVAWMTYGYRVDSGPRKEINATAFFGRGRQLLFQFICETDSECERQDFSIFESIVNSLRVGSAGIRHPNVTIVGSSECELCHKSLSAGKFHSVLNLERGRLIPVCDSCLISTETASSRIAPASKVEEQQPRGEAPKEPITCEEFSFGSVQELLAALEKQLLPNVERASQTDVNAFHISAQIKGSNVNNTDLAAFQNGLFRMIKAIAADFPVQRWKVKVESRMVCMTAISNGKPYYVATFMIDKNNRAYGF